MLISADAEDVSEDFLDYIVFRGIVKATSPMQDVLRGHNDIEIRCSVYPNHARYDTLINSCEE